MSCRDLRELTGLEPNNIVFLNISLCVGVRDGYTIKISSRFRWKSEQFSIVVGSRLIKLCVFLLFRVVQNLLYFNYKRGIKAKPYFLLHIFHDTSLGDPAWKPLPLRGSGFHAGRLVKYHGKYATTMWFCFNIPWLYLWFKRYAELRWISS